MSDNESTNSPANPSTPSGNRRRRSRRKSAVENRPPRAVDYHNLVNPFTPQKAFSDDEAVAIHENALRVLEELGVRVLLPEARDLFTAAGALVDGESHMVRIGRDIVEAAMQSAPKRIELNAGHPDKHLVMELGRLSFSAGGGCPHATDRVRGRRPGTLNDFDELMVLVESFDALHMMQAAVEPQDSPVHRRHYDVTRTQLMRSNKLPFVFSRGTAQINDCFEMIRIARGIDRDTFEQGCYAKTIVNTNSPRQLDIPMAQGIIDFARAGQLSIVTPFCMLGAMAPVTIAGALSLQHAEALVGITLAQITRAGAPVMYGNFASNVDMKSGSPAFGTPEHVRATLGSGQLARLLGLPWRSSAGCGANTTDSQASFETQMSLWSAVLAGATLIVHSAGWLEGGLTIGYEKLITDMEAVQTFAELCTTTPIDSAELAFDAIGDVSPGGHFFSTAHTMDRYANAFYAPLVSDWSTIGQWQDNGAKRADERATEIWQQRLADAPPPALDNATRDALDAFIAVRVEQGGAPPVS